VIQSATLQEPAHSGNYLAWLDGTGTAHTDTMSQTITLRPNCSQYTFSFWLHIDTAKVGSTPRDTLSVQVVGGFGGSVRSTLATYSNANAAGGYVLHSFDLSAFAGQTITLKFTGTEDGAGQTSFVIDDTAMTVS
jgi:hypothetical protein